MAKKTKGIGSIIANKKDIEKNLIRKLGESASAAIGGIASRVALNGVAPKIKNENIRRMLGVIDGGVGVGINVISNNNYLDAFSHGFTSAGFQQAALDLLPADATVEGLGSLHDLVRVKRYDELDGIGNLSVIEQNKMKQLAAQAEKEIEDEIRRELEAEHLNGEDGAREYTKEVLTEEDIQNNLR